MGRYDLCGRCVGIFGNVGLLRLHLLWQQGLKNTAFLLRKGTTSCPFSFFLYIPNQKKKIFICVMDFELTEEQQAVRDAAREFSRNHLLPGVIERDTHAIFPEEQIREMGRLGFM